MKPNGSDASNHRDQIDSSSTTTPPIDVARSALNRLKNRTREQGHQPAYGKAQPSRKPRTEGSTNWSGPRADERDPEVIGNSIQQLLGDQDWQQHISVASLTARWAEIVGTEVARHAKPISFERHGLVLQASSTAWVTQLRIMTPKLLSRIADEIGPGVVAEVKIVGPNNLSFKRGPKSVPGRGARDTWG